MGGMNPQNPQVIQVQQQIKQETDKISLEKPFNSSITTDYLGEEKSIKSAR